MRRATEHELDILDQALDHWEHYSIPESKAKKHGLTPGMFNLDQLAIGTVVEMEHTSLPEVALEIAMIHLEESPDYYAALEQVENIALSSADERRICTDNDERKYQAIKKDVIRTTGASVRVAQRIAAAAVKCDRRGRR